MASLKEEDLGRILALIKKYPQCYTIWKILGQTLEVDYEIIQNLEEALTNGGMQLDYVFNGILMIWMQSRSNAKLSELCHALDLCQMREVSDDLEAMFCLEAVKSLKIKLCGYETELERVTQITSLLVSRAIYNQLKKTYASQPITLLTDGVNSILDFKLYVSRTLSQIEIDENIFKDDSNTGRILLVKGIHKKQLQKLCGSRAVDVSGNQIERITATTMILKHEEHFDLVSRKSENPTHLLKYQKGSFVWVKSNGKMDSIRPFMLKKSVTFKQNDFIKMVLSCPPPCTVCISGPPGSGKSVFLTSLAGLASKLAVEGKSAVFFIALNDFARQIISIDSSSVALAAIAEFACPDELSKLILREMMNNITFEFNLLLDAYDEVAKDKLAVVENFLNCMKSLRNFRLFVSTRPHMKFRLENVLNVISFEIMPLNKTDQEKLLKHYWVEKFGAQPGQRLNQYLGKCRETLHRLERNGEIDIASNPLHCRLIAEVFGESAKRNSEKGPMSTEDLEIAVISDLYNLSVDLKFGWTPVHPVNFLKAMYWFRGSVRTKYINRHVLESVALLFPDQVEKFKPSLEGFDEIEMNTLYSIGLIEKISEDGNAPKFVHNTFAAYILAQYLVSNLTNRVDFIQDLFRGIVGVEGDTSWKLRDLKPPPMAYFVNIHLNDFMKMRNLSMNELVEIIGRACTEIEIIRDFEIENVCKAITTLCGVQGLELCFDLSMRLFERLHHFLVASNELPALRDTYFKYLPHLAVERSQSHELVKKVLGFTNQIFDVDITYHINDIVSSYPWIPLSTPLHFAAYYGKYDMVVYLVQQYGDRIKYLKFLLHMCVRDSKGNSVKMVIDKLSILELLLDRARRDGFNWEEQTLNSCSPFEEKNIHPKLYQRLKDAGFIQKSKNLRNTDKSVGPHFKKCGKVQTKRGLSAVARNSLTIRKRTPKQSSSHSLSTMTGTSKKPTSRRTFSMDVDSLDEDFPDVEMETELQTPPPGMPITPVASTSHQCPPPEKTPSTTPPIVHHQDFDNQPPHQKPSTEDHNP